MVHYVLVPAVVISDGQHPKRSALCDIGEDVKITRTLIKEMRAKSKVHGGVFFFFCKKSFLSVCIFSLKNVSYNVLNIEQRGRELLESVNCIRCESVSERCVCVLQPVQGEFQPLTW